MAQVPQLPGSFKAESPKPFIDHSAVKIAENFKGSDALDLRNEVAIRVAQEKVRSKGVGNFSVNTSGDNGWMRTGGRVIQRDASGRTLAGQALREISWIKDEDGNMHAEPTGRIIQPPDFVRDPLSEYYESGALKAGDESLVRPEESKEIADLKQQVEALKQLVLQASAQVAPPQALEAPTPEDIDQYNALVETLDEDAVAELVSLGTLGEPVSQGVLEDPVELNPETTFKDLR